MKLGLALAGGGVKGAAHIGVLKALEENNIKIDAIAGTSAGSVVASLYAMGYTPKEMLEISKISLRELMRANPRYLAGNIKNSGRILGNGLFPGENIENILNECANQKGIKYLKDLKIPISIPTVDIVENKKYVFTNFEGLNEEYYIKDVSIGKAVRASSSYPGVFTPCILDNHKFVDGGLLDNYPADEVKKLGVDKVLTIKFASDINYDPKNIYDIIFKSIDILFEARANDAKRKSDLVMDLELPEARVFDMKKSEYCYDIGYVTTITKIKQIKKMLNEE